MTVPEGQFQQMLAKYFKISGNEESMWFTGTKKKKKKRAVPTTGMLTTQNDSVFLY